MNYFRKTLWRSIGPLLVTFSVIGSGLGFWLFLDQQNNSFWASLMGLVQWLAYGAIAYASLSDPE